MTVETRLMTADELLQMPDDGMRHELVRGELVTMAPAGNRHSYIAMSIANHLFNFVKERGLGIVMGADCGFIIATNPDTVRAPDAAFIQSARYVDGRGYFPGSPDLAVEVMSPNDRITEVIAKVREYLRAGTQVVILVDPDREVASIHSATGDRQLTINDSLEAPDLLPGWSLPLRDLFA